MVVTGFVADTTSLPLVISNLVNIVSANYFAITFDRYAAVMVPVDLVSLAVTLGVLWFTYRRAVPARYPVAQLEAPSGAIRDRLIFRAAFPLLALLLTAYFVLAPLGVPVAAVTGAAALVLLGLALRGRVVPVGKVLRGAPWQIVVFSLGMYLVVYGLRNAGLTGHLAGALVWLAGQGPWVATIGTGFGTALLSSVMNNLPGVLVGALSIEAAKGIPVATRELMIYANIIGCDLGPKFTPIGSLAPLLWLHVLGAKGIRSAGASTCALGLPSPRPCCWWCSPPWPCGCRCWGRHDGGNAVSNAAMRGSGRTWLHAGQGARLSPDLPVEEVQHGCADLQPVGFQREMVGVKEVDLGANAGVLLYRPVSVATRGRPVPLG